MHKVPDMTPAYVPGEVGTQAGGGGISTDLDANGTRTRHGPPVREPEGRDLGWESRHLHGGTSYAAFALLFFTLGAGGVTLMVASRPRPSLVKTYL